jgi:hypothetical protein
MAHFSDGPLLKEVGGVKVYVTEAGKFAAEVGGKWVTRASLKDLERLVLERRSPVRLMKVDSAYVGSAYVHEVAAIEPSAYPQSPHVRFASGRREYFQRGHWYPVNAEFLARVGALLERRRRFEEELSSEYGALVSSLGEALDADGVRALTAARGEPTAGA